MMFGIAVSDLLQRNEVTRMAEFFQHSHSCNLLWHLLFTSWISFRLCTLLGLDAESAARAALLHDFRDADSKENKRLSKHSRRASFEAANTFSLSKKEAAIIKTHMWPICPTLIPRSREAWIVSIADKVSCLCELVAFVNGKRISRIMAFAF